MNINTTKNLLAFSGGIDSTALFFLLLEQKIPFDIAIVDYNVREQSKEEVDYAQALAKKFNKACFVKNIKLDSHSNFEQKARNIRYTFFEELILKHSYETLITAHQLDDAFEWFLMQLSKGAGLVELLGLQKNEKREFYTLCRPMLEISKEELLSYLKAHNINYFIDESNSNTKYSRNKMRKEFSSKFLAQYKTGVKKSFEYLQEDIQSLNIKYEANIKEKEFERFVNHKSDNINIRIIDKSLKKRGFLLSKKQRDEIKEKKEVVISHKIAVSITEHFLYLAPYCTKKMDKQFKEKCRVLKIPKNIRGYLSDIRFDLNLLAV